MQFLRLSSALLAGLLSSWAAHPSDKLLNPSNLPLNGILYSSFEKGTLVDQAGAWAMTAHIAGTLADAMFVSMSGETYIGTNSRVYLVVEHAFASAPGGLMDRTDYGKWLLLFDTGIGYYRLYEYDEYRGHAAGRYWIFPSSGTPTGAGSWMRGFRFADATGAPTKEAAVGHDREEVIVAQTFGDTPPEVARASGDMIHELEALKKARR
jgi:hypothetical protein